MTMLKSSEIPKVAIIIPTWNRKKDLLECLSSLKKLTCSHYEIIVIDNASEDGTASAVESQFPEVYLIRNTENVWFCKANNSGIRKALEGDADYIFLLNDDCVVDPPALYELVKVAEEDKEVGIVGATVYLYENPAVIGFTGRRLNRWLSTTISVSKSEERKDVCVVDHVAGCSMLIKKEVIDKIGLLDEKFFAYFEDLDFCVRAQSAGYKVVYTRKAKVWHKKVGYNNSIKGSWLKILRAVETAKAFILPDVKTLAHFPSIVYYTMRNRALFMKKNVNFQQFIVFFFLYSIFFLPARLIFFAVKGRGDLMKATYFGFYDFVRGKYGKANL